jgi:natural product biosynthesis luciferase-like monooxygenase protein
MENMRSSTRPIESHAPGIGSSVTLVSAFRARALARPDAVALVFLKDGDGAGETRVTLGELDALARGVAGTLQRLGAEGERAILLYPPGIEYIAAFFGCLYAGVLAVPAYPPDPSRLQRSLPRLVNICGDSGAKYLLTTSAIAAMGPAISEMTPVLREMSWVASDEVERGAATRWSMPSMSASDLAFLQYTSGSTGNPRGVMLSHENLLHNIALIRDAAEMEEDSTGVSWLPPYHDMGLIGSILCPLLYGGPLVFMSPLSFLGRPLRWLAAITKYRGVVSGAPNFAFDLCVRRVAPEEVRALDLSSWRVALSGAEPVRQATLEQFARHFAPAGFQSRAFYPCYGLAEATLLVSGGTAGTGASVFAADSEALKQNRAVRSTDPSLTIPLISCGRAGGGQSVVVVDPSSLAPLPPGSIGELWVAGPSVARGYWARAEESLHTFRAYLADGTGPFLRTGDLGFMREGDISITGRLKDLIIIRGANYYPQDFERTAESAHPRLRKGCVVAFAFNDGGEERLVVVAEVERRSADRARATVDAASAVSELPAAADFVIADVVAAIREAIAGQHQLQVYAVVLIPPGTLPKTSSGKVQRQGTRAEYMAGTLTELARDVTKTSSNKSTIRPNNVSELIRFAQRDKGIALVEMVLVGDVARILKLSRGQVAATKPINSFGIDSLLGVELAHKVERSLGVVVAATHFLREGTLRELAVQLYDIIIDDMAPPSARPRAIPASRQNVLSKGQSALWLMNGLRTGAAYNLVSAFRVRSPVDAECLRQSYQFLYDRHETLRTVFTIDAAGAPSASSRPGGGVGFKVVDSSAWSEDQLRAAVEETAHAPFDLENGPIMRVHLYSRGERDHTLVVAMHHIAADLWSLVVLMGEWGAAYTALLQGKAPALPGPESTYSTFIQWQSDILAGPEADRSWNFWRSRFSGGVPVLELPTDRPRPPVQTFRGSSARVAIGADLSARVRAFAKGMSVTAYSVLLAAFQTLLARYSGQTEFVVGTPVSGRTRAGFDKTVGYFVNVLPLLTAVDKKATGRSLTQLAQAGALDALEHQDYPFVDLVERLAPRRDASRSPMFDTMFIFERPHLGPERGVSCLMLDPAASPTEWAGMQLEGVPIEDSAAQFDLVLVVVDTDQGFSAQLKYNTDLFDARTGAAMAGHLERLLDALVTRPDERVWGLDFLSAEEKGELAAQPPAASIPPQSVHGLIEAQAARSPDALAAVFGDKQLTYRQLDERASELAGRLALAGAREGALVAICLERSLSTLVAMLAALKTGAAYVPVDPDYPLDRQLFVLADARPRVLVTSRGQSQRLADPSRQIVCVEDVVPRASPASGPRRSPPARPGSLAYVIYTSGSTGKPKGVMIPHRTVVNFFASMDEVLGTGGGTWLAITSISFDISVLELLWTLTRGMKVVIQRADVVAALPRKTLDMGIMFWGQDDAAVGRDRYQFFLDAAAHADEAGLSALWIPERHFHGFGGNYPNPSVLAAAAAVRTKRIAIRSGSVVLPLQNPVRVAEEWAVVDNLSNGRVGLAIASGWHKNDFVLSPGAFDERSKVMLEGIDLVRHLWRGGSTQLPNGKGEPTTVATLPRPVQKELPIWLTAAGSPQTFATAGKRGYNVLTHLLGQDLPTLAEKIAVYRKARREAGHDDGRVTLMLHTFVHEDERRVREVVRGPFTKYLEQSVDLFTPLYRELGLDPTALTPKDRATLLEFAFERYFSTSGLFGTPAACRAMLGRVADIGVDEIACLIEFGIDSKTVLEGLRHLSGLQRDDSFPAQVRRHGVTHLQCTPSTARVLVETGSRSVLGQLERLLVGGEALPGSLAATLGDAVGDRVTNMYGPTETTIWSSTFQVARPFDAITSIGRPIRNTSMYVLDERLQLVPLGARGELFIGGEGLARGYLNRPDLTAERFVPDPFGKPGSRMYATGDVARRLPDGTFQYIGRNDQQVKVRGFRVELGEIESVIQRHASVKDAAVIADDDPSGDRRLIAYVVPAAGVAGHVPAAAGLREAVASALPGYMVPSAFVVLDELPLTPNGKVDRLALRVLQVAPVAAEVVLPRDVVEQALCLEWADLMGREQVGIDDDFFSLGGHSLMATRLRTRVAEHFGVELAVADLFQATTVRKLAEIVRPHPHVVERAALLVEVLSDATEQARSA